MYVYLMTCGYTKFPCVGSVPVGAFFVLGKRLLSEKQMTHVASEKNALFALRARVIDCHAWRLKTIAQHYGP